MYFLLYRCGYKDDLLFDEINSANLKYLGYGRIVCFACKFCAPKRYFTTKTYDSATRGVFWSNRPKIKANPTTTGVFWSKLCPKIHAY